MQRIRQLLVALDGTDDQDEQDEIQEEIWALEEAMEFNENEEYKERHVNSKNNAFQ